MFHPNSKVIQFTFSLTIILFVELLYCTRDTYVDMRNRRLQSRVIHLKKNGILKRVPAHRPLKGLHSRPPFSAPAVEGQGMMRFPKEQELRVSTERECHSSVLLPLRPLFSLRNRATLIHPPKRLRLPRVSVSFWPLARSHASRYTPLKIIILRLIVGRKRSRNGVHSSGALDATIASPDFRAATSLRHPALKGPP